MTRVSTSETTDRARPSHRFSFHLRSFTSFVVTLSFLLMAYSGVVLYSAPGGKVDGSSWVRSLLLGLSRPEWVGLHIVSSALFTLFAVVHLVLNGRVLLNYLRTKLRRGLNRRLELLASGLLVSLLALGTLLEWRPPVDLVNARIQIRRQAIGSTRSSRNPGVVKKSRGEQASKPATQPNEGIRTTHAAEDSDR
jgi:hypothetical protein